MLSLYERFFRVSILRLRGLRLDLLLDLLLDLENCAEGRENCAEVFENCAVGLENCAISSLVRCPLNWATGFPFFILRIVGNPSIC